MERNTLLFVLLFDMRNMESIIYSDFVLCLHLYDTVFTITHFEDRFGVVSIGQCTV